VSLRVEWVAGIRQFAFTLSMVYRFYRFLFWCLVEIDVWVVFRVYDYGVLMLMWLEVGFA
jgi:hypothetical protein